MKTEKGLLAITIGAALGLCLDLAYVIDLIVTSNKLAHTAVGLGKDFIVFSRVTMAVNAVLIAAVVIYVAIREIRRMTRATK